MRGSSSCTLAETPPKGAVRIVLDEATACLDVAALIDLKAEIARLEKEIARHKGDIAGIEKKLSNEQFVAKAPPEVIEEQHTRRAAAEAAIDQAGRCAGAAEGGGVEFFRAAVGNCAAGSSLSFDRRINR